MKAVVGALQLVLVITSLALPAAAAPGRKILTLRAADRAIDLAFQAELAGDAKGAHDALAELASTSTLSEELVGRERLQAWMEGLSAREAAFKQFGPSARGYLVAHSTLKDYGLGRSELMWTRALAALPELKAVATASVSCRVRVDRLGGQLDRPTIVEQVSAALTKHGLQVERQAEAPRASPGRVQPEPSLPRPRGAEGPAKPDRPQFEPHFEVRIDADVLEEDAAGRGAKVTANVALLLRELRTSGGGRSLAAVAKHRTESRRTTAEARQIAVRRAVEDAGQAVAFMLRNRLLEITADSPRGERTADKR